VIPNNPNFSDDKVFEDTIEILPIPPKSVVGLEAMAIGGDTLDGGFVSRLKFSYWSITPVGEGDGLESRFELRKYDYDSSAWALEHSIDAEFTDSSTFIELSLAFDKNNHLFVTYQDHTGINIFWFDSRVDLYNTNPYGLGETPRMFYDGGFYGIHNLSDVIFLYTRDQILYMSNSSEFFINEYNTLPIDENLGIKDINLTITGKLQITFHKIPLDTLDHVVEICDSKTQWTNINKNVNEIKRC